MPWLAFISLAFLLDRMNIQLGDTEKIIPSVLYRKWKNIMLLRSRMFQQNPNT